VERASLAEADLEHKAKATADRTSASSVESLSSKVWFDCDGVHRVEGGETDLRRLSQPGDKILSRTTTKDE
jgi:hypothetical protein